MKQALVIRFGREIAAALVLLVGAQLSEAAVLPLDGGQQQPAQQQPAQQQPAQQSQPAAPAQSPNGQQTTAPSADTPQAPAPATPQAQEQTEPGFASRSQDQPQQDAQKPVGTAAGPLTRPTGVAGSRPAGAAIAPAKQRRVKAIVIRVGLIVAGAAATGAVIGLSRGSSSRP